MKMMAEWGLINMLHVKLTEATGMKVMAEWGLINMLHVKLTEAMGMKVMAEWGRGGLGAFRLRVVTRPVRLPPHFPGLAIPSFKPHSGSGPPGKQIISRMAP